MLTFFRPLKLGGQLPRQLRGGMPRHYTYVKRDALVIYTSKTVEVYIDKQRVAVHERLFARCGYGYQTNEKHMPSNH